MTDFEKTTLFYNNIIKRFNEYIRNMEPQDAKEMGFLLGMQHARDIVFNEFSYLNGNEDTNEDMKKEIEDFVKTCRSKDITWLCD